MEDLLLEYLPILIFMGLSLVVGLALLIAPFIIAPSKPDPEKLAAYECGFDAFDDARMKFDVKYYLVAILFIIFDLEVAFLFPWAVALGDIGLFGFWSFGFSLVSSVRWFFWFLWSFGLPGSSWFPGFRSPLWVHRDHFKQNQFPLKAKHWVKQTK